MMRVITGEGAWLWADIFQNRKRFEHVLQVEGKEPVETPR